jgi:hypothetical protein
MTAPSADDQVAFLLRVQRLLEEGSFVATYKFALLIALSNVSVELGDDSGNEMKVEARALGEQFIRSYWRQTLPYVPVGVAAARRECSSSTPGSSSRRSSSSSTRRGRPTAPSVN